MKCNVVWCDAMPCRVVPCHAVPCGVVPCRDVPCSAVTCHAMPCEWLWPRHVHAMQCRVVSCRAVSCSAVRCHAEPWRVIPSHTILRSLCFATIQLIVFFQCCLYTNNTANIHFVSQSPINSNLTTTELSSRVTNKSTARFRSSASK